MRLGYRSSVRTGGSCLRLISESVITFLRSAPWKRMWCASLSLRLATCRGMRWPRLSKRPFAKCRESAVGSLHLLSLPSREPVRSIFVGRGRRGQEGNVEGAWYSKAESLSRAAFCASQSLPDRSLMGHPARPDEIVGASAGEQKISLRFDLWWRSLPAVLWRGHSCPRSSIPAAQ